MFSIQKWFAKDDQFFRLLEASAEEGRASVQELKQIVCKSNPLASLEGFAAARRKDKQITTQIAALLARTSITSLDREDIEAISNVLYKIPKTVEKFAEHYMVAAAELRGVDFSKQITLVEQAIDIVTQMIRELEKSQFEQVNQLNEKLQTIEGNADDLMLALLKELYSNKFPPLTAIMVKDLYELLEKVVDRCRDVGNVVANVVLKNS
jgi:uncharacterized protein Yka (UPF0111/DUF47 family)